MTGERQPDSELPGGYKERLYKCWEELIGLAYENQDGHINVYGALVMDESGAKRAQRVTAALTLIRDGLLGIDADRPYFLSLTENGRRFAMGSRALAHG
jgi:hypothetical protein